MAQAAVLKTQGTGETRRMSWEEFLAWNPEHLHWEWVDGEAFKIMSASIAHQGLLTFLLTLINCFVRQRQLGLVFAAPALVRIVSRPSGREPDLFFVSQANIGRLTEQFLDGPADLVVEIVSPESDYRDRVTKQGEYEQAGVREYWVLDHREQESFFYQLDAQGYYQRVLADENGRYESAALPGFWINANWLWQEPKPLMEAMQALQIIPTA